jgi:accessory gene regulator protein AgrB
MNNWIIFVFGAIIGIGLGSYFTALAKPQKQWAELTEKEKKVRKRIFAVAILLFFIGVVVFFLSYQGR